MAQRPCCLQHRAAWVSARPVGLQPRSATRWLYVHPPGLGFPFHAELVGAVMGGLPARAWGEVAEGRPAEAGVGGLVRAWLRPRAAPGSVASALAFPSVDSGAPCSRALGELWGQRGGSPVQPPPTTTPLPSLCSRKGGDRCRQGRNRQGGCRRGGDPELWQSQREGWGWAVRQAGPAAGTRAGGHGWGPWLPALCHTSRPSGPKSQVSPGGRGGPAWPPPPACMPPATHRRHPNKPKAPQT